MALNEIAASLYAWDLADEGIDRCLDNLQERALVNSAYLVALMHREKRPLHARFYPHNPKRKYYCPEDSRAYWKPDLSCYGQTPIKPITSERDFLKGVDWLDVLIKAARKRGMKTGAEVSHTILDAEVAKAKFSDVLQRDVWGEPMGIPKRRVLPCPNAPAIRGYLVGLFTDLAKNHDVDFVQTCLLLFAQGRSEWGGGAEWQRLLDLAAGGCFCPSCEKAAKAAGHDWDRMVAETRRLANVVRRVSLEEQHEAELLDESNMTATALMLENPGFTEWLRFRVESVTGLFKLIHEETHKVNSKIDFRYNTHTAYPELSGIDFKSAYQWVDSVRESDYSDQLGTIEGLEIKRRKLHKIRRVLGDKPMLCALGVRPKATPEVLRAAVKIAHDCGSDGLSLGHYDGATMERLVAVAQGVREAEGQEVDWVPPSQRKPGR